MSLAYRFGPFELDTRAGDLRKGGTRIRLQEQPLRILRLLLERRGEVVLREEIQSALWPNGTVVEFGHGINAAVQRLRDALAESASSPRYIETVARRGYRFMGEVEIVEDRPEPEPDAAPEDLDSETFRTIGSSRRSGPAPWGWCIARKICGSADSSR
jgi:DNA-binding winged helix-turn-helix (wHTH) protein